MGDLMIGLAKTVVEAALSRAQTAIDEESKLRQKSQRDLVLVTLELEMIYSFLQVATGERLKNMMVRTWVKQVREMAYDFQDCIEFVVHLDNRPSWWFRLVPSFMAPPLPLDQAVTELEDLKVRAEELSKYYRRYSSITDSESEPKLIIMQQQQQQQQQVSSLADHTTALGMLAEARDATRREQGFGDLTRLVTKKDSGALQVISVCGTGGDHGTTSIIRKTYNHLEICQDFSYRAWVKLTQPFKPHLFIKSMMAQFYANSCQEGQDRNIGMQVLTKMEAAQQDLFLEFKRLAAEEKYLVVLEGLPNMVDWDTIRTFLPDTGTGSCIIVSTHQPEIATMCIGPSYQISELQKYSDDHSVCAVFKESSGMTDRIRMLVMLMEARETTEMNQCFADLTELITKDNNGLQVISVWGSGWDKEMPAFVIRKMYNHPEICKKYTYRAWVKVMHPFGLHDFIRSMMVQFYANSTDTSTIGMYYVRTKMKAKQADLFEEFEMLVTQERYLLVLEGMSKMVDWDAIRKFLPDTMNGSRIILSTQKFEIATLCIGHSYQISELHKFKDDSSVYALFKDSQGDVNNNKHRNGYHCDESKQKEPKEYKETHVRDVKIMLLKEEAVEWMLKNELLVGLDIGLNELAKNLAKARVNPPSVISVVGIAGVGKSALVKYLFYNRVLQSVHGYEYYCWVDVSHPFSLRDLYRNLLSDFHSEKDPTEECHRFLKQYRCLIVIDDLISTREWDLIQAALVCKHSKSVVIVITTDASVATYCTKNEDLVFNVKGLEAPAATYLFRTQVLKKNSSCTLDVHDQEVHNLVLMCGGIPRVIAFVAGLLATEAGKSLDPVHSLSRRLMHQLEYDSIPEVFAWMRSHFNTIPDSLKPCIFYLSIFPCGHIIRCRRLVRRWIAEGYSRDSHNESADENGEQQFSRLLQLGIIKQLSSPSVTCTAVNVDAVRMVLCQVNGFIREYIASRQMEENLVFALGEKCAGSTQQIVRHLVIMNSWERDKIVFKSIDFSRLRSLTVFGNWESFLISKSMKMLRVLDLEDASALNVADLDNMVEWLRRLKFLSLRGHMEIHTLPSSLCHMRQLQTLDIRDTSIVTLPESITNLHKLQYMRAGIKDARYVSASSFPQGHLVGVEVPRGIEKLIALQTLGVVNITGSRVKSMMKQLKELTQLRKIGVSGLNMKNIKDFVESVPSAHLDSLTVQLDKDIECCLDDISIPWVNLRSLKLYGLGCKLPKSMQQLSKLTKLALEMEKLKQIDIELLAKLPEICILRLAVKQPSILFHFQLYGIEEKSYEKVKILEIGCSSNNLHITFGSKSMKNLELLTFDCSSASYQLTGLNDLSELKEVLLKGTSDGTIKTDLESQLANHPKMPAVKLE